jgi:phage terminase small subunit
VHDWPLAWRTGLVAGIDTVQERIGTDPEGKPEFATVRKVRLADRAKLLEMIGKHVDIGAFKERIEIGVTGELAERLSRARSRG